MSSSPEEYGQMVDEVAQEVANGTHFNLAFSWAAHRRGIYFGQDRNQYNLVFGEVLRRFRKKNREALKKSLTGPRKWQHGKRTRSPKRPKPRNSEGRTRLKPGIEVEVYESPYLPFIA